ncbi:MAG: rod-binding protein [Vallitaleaceae bacterium]|nr:rod-binding protein [Vallitaleaceae bacterium]
MEIKGIGNDINTAYAGITASQDSEDSFKKIMEAAMKNEDDEALQSACKDFEAYYIQQLFTQMRKTIPDGGMFAESNERNIYEDMLYEEHAKNLSKGKGIGIADVMYRQLSKIKENNGE